MTVERSPSYGVRFDSGPALASGEKLVTTSRLSLLDMAVEAPEVVPV